MDGVVDSDDSNNSAGGGERPFSDPDENRVLFAALDSFRYVYDEKLQSQFFDTWYANASVTTVRKAFGASSRVTVNKKQLVLP